MYRHVDIDRISDRSIEIYGTSSYGIKESIDKAKMELTENVAVSKINIGGIKNEQNKCFEKQD